MDAAGPVAPVFGDDAVTVVFCSDHGFAPMMAVAIRSLLDRRDPGRPYDLIVLHDGIARLRREVIARQADGADRVSLRFVDVSAPARENGMDGWPVGPYYKQNTYHRLLIPHFLPAHGKAVYLDGDIVVRHDVGALFDVDLGDHLVAAAPDTVFRYAPRMQSPAHVRFVTETLGLRDINDYFNAGVMVWNIRAMRRENTMDAVMELGRSTDQCFCADNDLLNVVCQGRVLPLDGAWNFLWPIVFAAPDLRRVDGGVIDAMFAAARIVHYCGGVRPYRFPFSDMAIPWWAAARRTDFYEHFLAVLADEAGERTWRRVDYAIGVRERLKRYAATLCALPLRPFRRRG